MKCLLAGPNTITTEDAQVKGFLQFQNQKSHSLRWTKIEAANGHGRVIIAPWVSTWQDGFVAGRTK